MDVDVDILVVQDQVIVHEFPEDQVVERFQERLRVSGGVDVPVPQIQEQTMQVF